MRFLQWLTAAPGNFFGLAGLIIVVAVVAISLIEAVGKAVCT